MFGKWLSKALRIITIAPIMALVLLTVLYTAHPEYFGGVFSFILAVIFLVVLPVIAYPLQPFVPKYRDRGREGQRNLAMVFAGIGYVLGIISAAVTDAPFEIWVIYLTYFISGLSIIGLNKLFGIRASGHACGVAGPIFALMYFFGTKSLWGIILLGALYWASLRMKRHNLIELLLGTAVPAAALLITPFIAYIIKN